ncbi:MAG: Crp/Fnr family transcriptional regulator [Gemmatimonadaceae bacterium]
MIPLERLSRLSLFRDPAPAVVRALSKHGMIVTARTNEVLFLTNSESRGWWIVLEGKVRVVRGEGARQHVVHTEGPGGTLGEVPLITGGTHPATAIAAEPTSCALFSRAVLESAIGEAPAIAFIVAQRLAGRVRSLVDRLDERSARSVQSRLIEFLLARPAQRGASISVGMTQRELAEELGTVREVVSREMRHLVRRGWLQSLGGGRYRILDAGALNRATQPV